MPSAARIDDQSTPAKQIGLPANAHAVMVFAAYLDRLFKTPTFQPSTETLQKLMPALNRRQQQIPPNVSNNTLNVRILQYILIFILVLISTSVYGQSDFMQDFNRRLIGSIYPPSPSRIIFTKSFCEILGMLDEYMGRHIESFVIPGDSLVENFYSTVKDNESAVYFRKLIESYQKEIGTTFKIRIQAYNGFYSKSLCSIINCLYIPDYNYFFLFTLDKDYILNLSDECKYAYLKGVYYRFGEGNEISIANGIRKLKTVALVMESLEVKNVNIYSSGPNSLPTSFILTFEATPYLKDKLNFRDSESKLKFFEDKRLVNYKK